MKPFIFSTTRSVQFGQGALASLGAVARERIGRRVMLVTDPGMIRTGIVQRALAVLAEAQVEAVLFQDVEADPPERVIHAAVGKARDAAVDGVIGLGGGSSLDVAKLVAVLSLGQERLDDIYGIGKVKGGRRPLVLIPTTAGTGSEVTPISIVTTATNEKMGVVSPVLLADIAILDPELTLGLPPHVTAATGIDAMVHAIEAHASLNANNNPVSKLLSREALTLMGRSLLSAVRDGSDIDARSEMLLGSMLAGQAFANAPVAAVHALAYPLGGHFHIPHGLSNALVLPHVLRFNAEHVPELYAEMAPFAFPELGAIAFGDRAAAFCDRLAALAADCGLPRSLREAGVPEDALPRLAADAMKQTRLLGNNPRPLTEADALAIYAAAYRGY